MPTKRGCRIELHTNTEAEKQALDAWAEKHGTPTSPFLLARLQDLMHSETSPKPKAGGDHKMRERITALETELAQTQAALRNSLMQKTPQRGQPNEQFLFHRIAGLLREAGTMREEVLLTELGLSINDREMKGLVAEVLERLEGRGEIKRISKGLRWIK